jgi:hypothetical protein
MSSCRWDPCSWRGVFNECIGGLICNDTLKVAAMNGKSPGQIPKLEAKWDPCGFKGLFGECSPLIKTIQTCPSNLKLRDGLCYED